MFYVPYVLRSTKNSAFVNNAPSMPGPWSCNMEVTFSANSAALVKMLDQFPQLTKEAVGKAMARETATNNDRESSRRDGRVAVTPYLP
jgi:hypothetical protein